MALVDPFIPQSRLRRVRNPQLAAGASPLAQSPVQATPGTVHTQFPKLHTRTFEAPRRRAGRTKLVLQGVAVVMLAIILGLAASAQLVGEVTIFVYAVVALALRFPSGTSFALALLALMMIVLLQVLRPMSNLAANFAVYAFLLLIVGVLSFSLEVRQAVKWKKWRRQPKGKHRA
jgi:K+-sensing histidine kinase KdpD